MSAFVFTSTEELCQELRKRFDAIIIFGIQKNMKGDNVSAYYDSYIGDQATLIGLCELLIDKLKEEYKNNTIKPEEA